MEKSDLAGNAITFLHDEDYLARFAEPRLDAGAPLSIAGRTPAAILSRWRFAIDPFDTGLRQRWYEIQKPDGPRRAPLDWDPFDGEEIETPSCWNLLRPEWKHYEGGVWYAAEIEDPRRGAQERLFLRVGAANYSARVFLDGRFLGRHLGGSTPFAVELTDALVGGAGHLMIHVENTRSPDRLPTHHFDWFHYGGVHREAALYVTPAAVIRDAFVRLGADGQIRASVRIDGPADSAPEAARIEIPELGLDAPIPLSGGQGEAAFALRPELWSPEAPRLYETRISAGGDALAERVGFRTIEVRGGEILLNGAPIFLRGVAVHEDDAALGRVCAPEDVARRLAHAKALGANFLRLAHYPHHERAAQMADEAGVLLWAELPAYWAVNFASADTYADAENQLSELILRDRNRASVIIWGLANETPDTDDRTAFLGRLAERARTLDPTRPLSAACLVNQESLRIEDRLADIIDIVGVNEYFGWYDPDFGDLDRLYDQYDLGKPLVITETGCDVVAGGEGGPQDLNSEAFGRRYFDEQIKRAKGAAALRGFTPWLLYDFRTERRQTRAQGGWNLKGLIARDKQTRKSTFEVVAAYYRDLAG